jgi:hypothetical protein
VNEAPVVAREEQVEVARRKSSKKPETPSRRLSVQASDQWIAWVEEGADFCRTDVSKLVDASLATYLRSQGFTKTPPKRVP